MDERRASMKSISGASRDRGVPAVGIVARTGEELRVFSRPSWSRWGRIKTQPLRVAGTPEFQRAVAGAMPLIEEAAPGVPNARWIAIRLLDGTRKSSPRSERTSRRPGLGPAEEYRRFQPEDSLQGPVVTQPPSLCRAAELRQSLERTSATRPFGPSMTGLTHCGSGHRDSQQCRRDSINALIAL